MYVHTDNFYNYSGGCPLTTKVGNEEITTFIVFPLFSPQYLFHIPFYLSFLATVPPQFVANSMTLTGLQYPVQTTASKHLARGEQLCTPQRFLPVDYVPWSSSLEDVNNFRCGITPTLLRKPFMRTASMTFHRYYVYRISINFKKIPCSIIPTFLQPFCCIQYFSELHVIILHSLIFQSMLHSMILHAYDCWCCLHR